MRRTYTAPDLVEYGSVNQLTGVFGSSGADDVFLDENGNDISPPFGDQDPNEAGGSIDSCAAKFLDDGGNCIAKPSSSS